MKFAARCAFRQFSDIAINNSDTMPTLSRRSFLAAAGALTALPALGAVPASGDVDIIIVGAGAAGIAAARRVAAAGQRFALLEAADHIGGRCVTDTETFGVPFDLGAHWLYTPASDPLAKLAGGTGLDLYAAPRGQKLRVGPRAAREGELEDFLAALVRSNRAIREAARGKADAAAARALPSNLRDWRQTVEFVLGPFHSSKDLTQISALDFSRSAERELADFCRRGLGTLLAKLAAGLPVQRSRPVRSIEWLKTLQVETDKDLLRARAVIVTASTGVLASGKIKFVPELPDRWRNAFAALSLGSYDHIGLELLGNPFGLQADDLVFEKSSSNRTAALLARVSGTDLHVVSVGGAFGRELSAQGRDAMAAFAVEWLASIFGTDIKNKVGRSRATRWDAEPWILGASSAASPGNQDARRALTAPLRERVWFAGEAAHETLYGTVGGAWESGARAAEAALRAIGAIKAPGVEKRHAKPEPRHQDRRRRRRRNE